MDRERETVLRLAAAVLAVVEIPLVVFFVVDPSRIGLSAAFVLVMGSLHLLAQVAVAATPWQRLVGARRLTLVARVHVGTTLTMLLITVTVASSLRADLLWVVGLALVHAGIVLPLRDQWVVIAATTTVLVVVVATDLPPTAEIVTPFVVLPSIGVLAALGARVVERGRSVERDGRERAERSEDALRAVLGSVGESVSVDRQRILDAVARAAASIRNDQSGVYWLTPDGAHMTYAAAVNIPAGLRDAIFPVTAGLAGRVVAAGTTVVTTDYASFTNAMPAFVEHGLTCGIGTPIRTHGAVVGVLVGGRRWHGEYSDDEVAAFELLARNAGQALEVSEQVAADRRLLTHLRELDRMKQDFVTTVSHELRTPLTVISGLSETLAEHGETMAAEQRHHLMSRIHANSLSLGGIVNSLLDTASIDNGLVAAAMVPFDIVELVSSCTSRLEGMFQPGVLTSGLPDRALAVGDAALLERVVDNLLVNAERHTPSGTQVAVRVVPHGRDWRVEVTDAGPGIPQEDRERILTRFERGGDPNSRPRGGLGLGLALCEEILRLHQSQLELESVPGRTTFAFTVTGTGAAADGERRVGQVSDGSR